MKYENEVKRHEGIMELIDKATTIEELPNVTRASFSSFLSSNVYFDKTKISQKEFNCVTNLVFDVKSFDDFQVRKRFVNVLKVNYSGKEEKEYVDKYDFINNHVRTKFIIEEVEARESKIRELMLKMDLDNHNRIMKEIDLSFSVKDLPKVSKGMLNKLIVDRINANSYGLKVKTSNIVSLVDVLFDGNDSMSIEFHTEVYRLCRNSENYMEVIDSLLRDKKIEYLVEEINKINERTTKIYKINHEENMDAIKDARRMSQLPPNMSISAITSYLSGNSTIYTNGPKIPSNELINVVEMLLNGKDLNDEEVLSEFESICSILYPEKEDAKDLLVTKFSSLPRLMYMVDEVKYALERQKEFISRGSSNVNVYFIPNPKAPATAGRFFNCYINRAQNLDLSTLLPLNLDEIVPEGMDVDSIEWYVQENYDETFKASGGIILQKDESIGNVTVFQPSEGKIGITVEEHAKNKELEELSGKVKDLISKKRSSMEQFKLMQEQFIASQTLIDEELSKLEERIDSLTNNDGPVKKLGGNNE